MKDKFHIVEIEHNGNYFDYMRQEVARIHAMQKMGYTNKKVGFIDKIILLSTYKLLKRLSKENVNSEELLATGYHIRAIKN